MAGEVGEVCHAAKRKQEGGPRAAGVTPEMFVQELADTYLYLQRMAESLGANRAKFIEAVETKLKKIQARATPSSSVPS